MPEPPIMPRTALVMLAPLSRRKAMPVAARVGKRRARDRPFRIGAQSRSGRVTGRWIAAKPHAASAAKHAIDAGTPKTRAQNAQAQRVGPARTRNVHGWAHYVHRLNNDQMTPARTVK